MRSEDMRGQSLDREPMRQIGSPITVQPVIGVVNLDDPVAVRRISDVGTLRIVADPTRLAILRTLMTDAESAPPVMSAKELASTLSEPQTKLYRHLKQLEDAGLIQVAETRLVSGIVEQRYRTGQLAIAMSPDMLVDPATRDAATEGLAVAFDDFRDELVGNVNAGRVRLSAQTALLNSSSARVPRERADELRGRLNDVIREFTTDPTPDGVSAHLFVAWYEDDDS